MILYQHIRNRDTAFCVEGTPRWGDRQSVGFYNLHWWYGDGSEPLFMGFFDIQVGTKDSYKMITVA